MKRGPVLRRVPPLPQAESFLENAAEYRRYLIDIQKNDHDSHHKITDRHDRNHDIQNFDRSIFAQYDNRRQNHQHDGSINRRNMKGIIESGGHRITDHLTDAAPADQTGNRK